MAPVNPREISSLSVAKKMSLAPRAAESHLHSFGVVKDDDDCHSKTSAKRIIHVERSVEEPAAAGKKHIPVPSPHVLVTRRRTFSCDSASRADSVSSVLSCSNSRTPAVTTPRERTADRIFPSQEAETQLSSRGRSQYSWAIGNGNITDWERPQSARPASGRRSCTPQPTSPEFNLRALISSKRRLDAPGQSNFENVLQGIDGIEIAFRPTIRPREACIATSRDYVEPTVPKRRPLKRPNPQSTFADTQKIFQPAEPSSPAAAPTRQEPVIANRSRTGRKFVPLRDANDGVSRRKHIEAVVQHD